MDNEEIRVLVWEEMLDADYRSRYFADIAARKRRLNRLLSLLVAILTSGALGTILINQPLAAGLCSLVATGLSWWLFATRPSELVRDAAMISAQWGELHSDYQFLWSKQGSLGENAVLSQWRKLTARHKPIDEMAISKFGYDRKLAVKIYNEMLRAGNYEQTETAT